MNKIQSEIALYTRERGWNKNKPADISKSIVIEGAELLEVFQWKNHSKISIKNNKELRTKVENELADVFIYCYDLANALNLDADSIVRTKLAHVREKYPAHKVKNNQYAYLAIKQQYRKNAQ